MEEDKGTYCLIQPYIVLFIRYRLYAAQKNPRSRLYTL